MKESLELSLCPRLFVVFVFLKPRKPGRLVFFFVVERKGVECCSVCCTYQTRSFFRVRVNKDFGIVSVRPLLRVVFVFLTRPRNPGRLVFFFVVERKGVTWLCLSDISCLRIFRVRV